MSDKKPPFDPSKPFTEVKPPFDPSKPFSEIPEVAKVEPSTSGSFGRGLAQGASLGFADEATAALATAYLKGKELVGAGRPIDMAKEYSSLRDLYRQKDVEAGTKNPIAYGSGTFAGGALSTIVPAAAVPKLGALVAGPSALARYGSAAGLGALGGAGYSEANLTTPEGAKDLASDVAKGAAIGATAQGIGDLLGKAASTFKPSNLMKTADSRVLKQAGYMGPELKKLSEAEKSQIANVLRDTKTVTAFKSLDDIAAKAAENKAITGKEIGNTLDSVDSLVKKAYSLVDEGKFGDIPEQAKVNLKQAISDKFQFNMASIGNRIESELIQANSSNPLMKGEMSKLADIAADFKSGKPMSLREGNVIKGTQGKITNFNSETVPQSFKQEVYSIIKDEIDQTVGRIGNLEQAIAKAEGTTLGTIDAAARGKSVLEDYIKSKKDYGALKKTADISAKRLGQLQANRDISLTDTIAAGAGMASGGPANAIAIGALNKLWRQNEATIVGGTARTAARILQTVPDALGPYAPILENAAKVGGVSGIRAAHQDLLQRPDYVKVLNDYESNPMQRRLNNTQGRQ